MKDKNFKLETVETPLGYTDCGWSDTTRYINESRRFRQGLGWVAKTDGPVHENCRSPGNERFSTRFSFEESSLD